MEAASFRNLTIRIVLMTLLVRHLSDVAVVTEIR